MAKSLGRFSEMKGVKGLMVADDGALRCTAVELASGDLCLFNPVKGLSDGVIEQLQSMGRVKYLLSPNFYHNRAFKEYAEHFGKATVCASNEARSRLQKVTGIKFAPLTRLKGDLPKHITLVETKGLKTGEVWLRVAGKEGVCWMVGDAFCGPKRKNLGAFVATPELLTPFPKFGVGDKAAYNQWLYAQIDADEPTTVIPSHGSLVRSAQLPKKLRSLSAKLA